MATEQCMHALDHLAWGGQFCDKRFELPILPAKVQTRHITSTFHVNVSKIMQYLQQQSQFKRARTETKMHIEDRLEIHYQEQRAA